MAGHQRTADTPADGGRADTPAGGGQADTGGGRYTADRHTCLRYGGRGDTDEAPTWRWRQGKVYQQRAHSHMPQTQRAAWLAEGLRGLLYQPPSLSGPPGAFYTCFYDHTHRLRLKKLWYLELSRSSNGYFKPLLDPGGVLLLKPPHGGLRSETSVT
jgi:hypothetical protein